MRAGSRVRSLQTVSDRAAEGSQSALLVGQRAVALTHLSDKFLFYFREFLAFLCDDSEAQVLGAVLQGDICHVVQRALVRELCDADRIKVGGGEQADLLHAVIDIDDLGGIIQIHQSVLCGNVVEKVLVLTDIAHKAVGEKLVDVQLGNSFSAQQLVIRGKEDVGSEFCYGGEAQTAVFKIPLHGIGLVYGKMNDTDFGIAVCHIVDHVACARLPEAQKQIFLILMARADIIEAHGCVGEACHGDDQTTALPVRLADEMIQTFHLVQDHLAMGQKTLAVFREAGALIGAPEQVEAYLLLDALDDVAELRLRDIHGFCRLVDGAVLRDPDKIFQVFCVQSLPPFISRSCVKADTQMV